MADSEYAEIFREEAGELLEELETSLLELEKDPADLKIVSRVFRAMHTIKGSGAMFGFDDIAGFTHHVETALDKVRDGSVPVSKELIDLDLSSRDHIRARLDAATGGGEADPVEGERIITALQAQTADNARQTATIATKTATNAGRLINEILPQIQKTAELVQEIDAASNEQARGIEENSKAVEQFDSVIQSNSAAAEEMASTSEELTAQASQMLETIAFFKLDDAGRQRRQLGKPAGGSRAPRVPLALSHAKQGKPGYPGGKQASSSGGSGASIALDDSKDFERY